MELVKIKNLSVAYDERVVLENVNLAINSDDFIAVIGGNGGGKTTLIKAILKSIPYKGEVIYDKQVENNGVRHIGYLPQVSDVDKNFPVSVTDVILSGLQSEKGLWGRYSKADKQKVMELAERTSISHLCRRSVGELSGGEMQRMLLCRALISDPVLLILDEPNTYVDSRFEGELYELLRELNNRMAIVMVSHDLGIVANYVKSIACVNRTLHYHNSNIITAENLKTYNCPIRLIAHGDIPHTVLSKH